MAAYSSKKGLSVLKQYSSAGVVAGVFFGLQSGEQVTDAGQ
jgi:hypothetical protein